MSLKSFIKSVTYVVGKSFRAECKKTGLSSAGNKPYYWSKAHDYMKYGISPEEYVQFCFHEKKRSEKANYVSLKEAKINFYLDKNVNFFPRDKYERYLMFRPFFNHEIIRIRFNSDEAEEKMFQEFCERHSEFILKPFDGSKGHGIQKVKSDDVPSLNALKELMGKGCLLEEVIRQGEEFAMFHPASINSIRFATGLNPEGKFTPLFAQFRTGVGGSIVDNRSSGGLVATIDLDKGIVATDALYGVKYVERHPESNLKYKGTVIPAWEELCALAEKAHRTLPKQKLIGWDFAWTADKKWDLIEANPMPNLLAYQTIEGKGIRSKMREVGLI